MHLEYSVILLNPPGSKFIFFSPKFNTLSLHLNNTKVLNLHCLSIRQQRSAVISLYAHYGKSNQNTFVIPAHA